MYKHILTILVCLVAANAVEAFDFSALAPTGQRIYFTKLDANQVKVVAPSSNSWGNYDTPAGTLTIPSSVSHDGNTFTVKEIDKMAFQQCYQLTSVTIPGSVSTIGLRAFANDTALTTLTLQEGVQRIDMMAFSGCSSLNNISLPSSITRIAISAFESTAYYLDSDNWNSHYTLTLGQWVIKEGNLYEDTVRIVEGIVGVANSAFLSCGKIPKVVFPSTIKYLGEGTFHECYELDTVQILNPIPPAVSTSTFEGLESVVILVPYGAAATYDTATIWNTMTIVEMPYDSNSHGTTNDSIIPINPWPGHPVIGIEDVADGKISVGTHPQGIVVYGALNKTLILYNMLGQPISTIRQAQDQQHIDLPRSGIYVLVVDNKQSIKISYLR